MKTYVFGNIRRYKEIREVVSKINDLYAFGDWDPGITANYVLISTNITGPSGASSGIGNYSSQESYTEYMKDMYALGPTGPTGP